MTDIRINNAAGSLLETLSSEDGTTVGDLLEMIGAGVLRKDGVLKASKSYVLKPGTYTWKEKASSQNLEQILEAQEFLGLQQVQAADERKKLERELLALKIKDSQAVSYAHYYNEKHLEGRVLTWAPAMQGAWLPQALQNPDEGSERDRVKPFWEGVLKERLLPGLGNGYEVGYLGTKNPDITFYPIEIQTPAPHLYVSFGDCKGSKWTGMSYSELGQAMQYAHKILDAQPQRSHVHGFLTNNKKVVLIKGNRDERRPFGIYWEITAPLNFDEGMRLYFHYLREDNGYVGAPNVDNSPLVIDRVLRPGGTCRAFAATYRQHPVVAKLYDSEDRVAHDAVLIRRAHQTLAAAGVTPTAQIPSVVATEGKWLVLTPLGTAFTENSLKLCHIKGLLQALKVIHASGMVHRDVRPANFFLLDDNGVLLNDWGSAAQAGTLVPVEGCPSEVQHPDLANAQMAAPQPKHDLYSLVASISDLFMPGLMRNRRRAYFQEAFLAANNEDYEGVVRAVEKAGVPQ